MEEVGLSAYHFDAQAFLFAAHDMDRNKFAALDTLQYGLARDAERTHRLAHWQEVLTGVGADGGRPRARQSEVGESAWNKDPVFGVIGIQSGPRGQRVQ